MRGATATLFAMIAVMLAACNTVEGIGRDVQSGGRVIEQGAEKTKQSLP